MAFAYDISQLCIPDNGESLIHTRRESCSFLPLAHVILRHVILPLSLRENYVIAEPIVCRVVPFTDSLFFSRQSEPITYREIC